MDCRYAVLVAYCNYLSMPVLMFVGRDKAGKSVDSHGFLGGFA